MKKRLIILTLLTILSVPSLAKYRMGTNKPVEIKEKEKKELPAFNQNSQKDKKSLLQGLPGSKQQSDSSRQRIAEEPYIQELSKKFDIEINKLEYLRSLRHGYEEMIFGLIVSREAQIEVGRVLQKRVEDQPWKEIAKSFFIDFSELKLEANKTLKPFQKKLPKSIIKERPQQYEQ